MQNETGHEKEKEIFCYVGLKNAWIRSEYHIDGLPVPNCGVQEYCVVVVLRSEDTPISIHTRVKGRITVIPIRCIEIPLCRWYVFHLVRVLDPKRPESISKTNCQTRGADERAHLFLHFGRIVLMVSMYCHDYEK